MQFSQALLSFQKRINKELERFFNKKIKKAESPFEKKVFGWLMEYSLRRGKRIRPVLVNYGYFLAGGKNKKAILETSIFIELIHNYLLIHDDIMDGDKIRRGGKSMHCICGTNMAIIVGDMANTLGYEILSSSGFPAKNKVLALRKLNQTLYSTGYGQISELALRNKKKSGKKISEGEVFEIYAKKTAFYTMVMPLQVGALLAGASESFLRKIEEFALPLGIAFQIKDDLDDGDIEKVFGFEKNRYQKIQEQLIINAEKSLILEKAFPKREKEFLLGLLDYNKFK